MTPDSRFWPPDDHDYALLADTIQVWRISQSAFEHKSSSFLKDLSEDELARADRFRLIQHKDRFIINRGVLRHLLGRYLDLVPRRVQFHYDSFGKPSLDPEHHGQSALQFNIAHSQDVSLFAFAPGFAVGVDCEYMRLFPNPEAIVRRFFSASEMEAFTSLPEEQHNQAFFTIWTLKEAIIKALGRGLSMPLDGFSISVKPGDGPRLIEIDGRSVDSDQWHLHSWAPAPGYMAAAACRRPGVILQHLEILPVSSNSTVR